VKATDFKLSSGASMVRNSFPVLWSQKHS
jgi:hypothetical protein